MLERAAIDVKKTGVKEKVGDLDKNRAFRLCGLSIFPLFPQIDLTSGAKAGAEALL